VFVNNPRKLHIQKGKNMTKVAEYLNLVVSSATLSGRQHSGETRTEKKEIFLFSVQWLPSL